MGKQSSKKKVQRAARAGGSRKASGRQTSLMWPGLISVVVVLGVALIVMSRGSTAYVRPGLFAEHPEDHWHMAFGINVCGEYRGNLGEAVNSGIHTHGDGLIHVEATNSAETGDKATVGKFIKDFGQGFRVSDDELRLPGSDTFENGDDCDGKKGVVSAYVWDSRDDDEPRVVTDGITDIRIRDHQLITFSFNPGGAELDPPPSAGNLSDPNAAEGGGDTTGTTQAPEPLTSTSVAGQPGATSPPTTAAGGTATTAP